MAPIAWIIVAARVKRKDNWACTADLWILAADLTRDRRDQLQILRDAGLAKATVGQHFLALNIQAVNRPSNPPAGRDCRRD